MCFKVNAFVTIEYYPDDHFAAPLDEDDSPPCWDDDDDPSCVAADLKIRKLLPEVKGEKKQLRQLVNFLYKEVNILKKGKL
jgi:hypothetical protein